MSTPLAEVREGLSRVPVFLAVFDRLVRALTKDGDIALAASGSLATGSIDQWSDLDLEVVLPPGSDVKERLKWTISVARSVASPLCYFPASHIGLDQILVFFFLEADEIVKVDVYVVELVTFLGLTGPRLLVDPGFVSEARKHAPAPRPPDPPDFEDLHMKFCGWIWYTYTKIQRGELLEAVDSLHCMRTRALLPSLQCIYELPWEGNRRLETRLPARQLAAVNATVPRSVERSELLRALLDMSRLFQSLQPLVAEKLGRDHQRARLDTMIRYVEALRSRS